MLYSLAADPDGTTLGLPARLMDLPARFDALRAARDDLTFGGLGRMRPARGDRPLQRVDDRLGGQPIAGHHADTLAAELIDRGEDPKAVPGGELIRQEIGTPGLIRRLMRTVSPSSRETSCGQTTDARADGGP